MGLAAGAAAAIGSITAGIGGAVAAGAGALGVGAATAGTIGAIAGPAIFGAGVGALGSAVTGGNPLTGALTGGVTGGLIGGVGGPLADSLGVSVPTSDALIGAGVGAGSAAITGGNPLLGGAIGGLGGYASGALGQSADAGTVNGSDTLTTSAPGSAAASGGVDAGTWDNNPLSADSAALSNGSVDTSGWGNNNPLSQSSTNVAANDSNAATGTTVPGKGGISNSALTLGALAAGGVLLGKLSQPKAATVPGPAQSTNLGPTYNMPLNTNVPGRTAVSPFQSPTPTSYYTYGQGPEQTFFQGNNLSNFGFARGGALNAANEQEFRTGSGQHRVRGPGTETSDSIPARLSNNEYVLDANDVRKLGGGDVHRGSKRLDMWRKQLDRGGGPLAQIAARGRPPERPTP